MVRFVSAVIEEHEGRKRSRFVASVEIRGLQKHYGDVHAVGGVDLSIADGEFLVLLGASGSGKTTLLRMIAGLEHPSSGEILIDGQRAGPDVPPRSRGVAMVFQSYALYPHRTVRENIAFPLRAQHAPRWRIEQRVTWAAELFHITSHLDRYPRQLSGGERQRVALCRALVREPRVFLFDEPLANLDAKLRNNARDEIKRFHRQVRTTTIYVTHDQVEAMGLGDRIAVMEHGRVRQVGTPQAIYDRPDDTFVATFLGQPPMNLILSRSPALAGGTVLGFRPEDLLPRQAFDAGEGVCEFSFSVSRLEYLGSERHLYGTVAEGDTVNGPVVSKLSGRMGACAREGEGQPFAVARSAMHLFDAATGARRSE
jgi:multiple sugar transport system ATP-binding protein